MRIPDEWTREADGVDIEAGGKRYRNMVEFSRPCKACGKKFSIHVTTRVAEGKGWNNNFDLKNCPEHRQRHINAADADELQKLREQLRNTNEYCAGLEKSYRDAFEEIQVLKARLARYELSAATFEVLASDLKQANARCSVCGEPQIDTPSGVTCANGHGGAIGCEAVQNTTASAPLKPFPWES